MLSFKKAEDSRDLNYTHQIILYVLYVNFHFPRNFHMQA